MCILELAILNEDGNIIHKSLVQRFDVWDWTKGNDALRIDL